MPDYQFIDCSNENFKFVIENYTLSPLTIGDIYYIESPPDIINGVGGYSGCSSVVELNSGSGVTFNGSNVTLVSSYTFCDDCLLSNSIEATCTNLIYCLDTDGYSGTTIYDGEYDMVGYYNGHNLYSGVTSGVTAFIFYNEVKWCLSSTIGGECIVYGAEPCDSICPDICSNILTEGICTTTTTICEVDFNFIFECPPEPTPCVICCECEPRDCDWYRYNDVSCACLQKVPAVPPDSGDTYNSVSYSYTDYSVFGTKIFDVYDITGSGTTSVILTGTDVWQNLGYTGNSLTMGPLNRCGIWTDQVSGSTSLPVDTWIGYSFCVNVTEEQTKLYIGMAADNHYAFRLNGELKLKSTDITNASFKYWNIFPMELSLGLNVIEFFGLNNGSVGGFGCEIYGNTLSELTGATQYSDLNILYTTRNNFGGVFDIIMDLDFNPITSGYLCPNGFVYNSCEGNCVKFNLCEDEIPPTPTPLPPYVDLCSGITMDLTFNYTPPTTASTTTTTTTFNLINITGQTDFTLIDTSFICTSISKKLLSCSGTIYYTNDNLIYDTDQTVLLGETFNAIINGVYECLTYIENVEEALNNCTVEEISAVFCGCENCIPPPTTLTTQTTTICCPE